MPLDIRPGITIRRPRREVAAIMFDARHEEAWLETYRRTEPEDGEVPERTMRFLLRDRPVNLHEAARDPERFVELRAEEPFPILIRQELESIPEGTLVRIRVHVQLRGWIRLLRRLVGLRLRRSLIADLETLKSIVENSPHRGMAAARQAVEVEATSVATSTPSPALVRTPDPQPSSPRPSSPRTEPAAALIDPPKASIRRTKGATPHW